MRRWAIYATSPKSGKRLTLTRAGLAERGTSLKFASYEDAHGAFRTLVDANPFLRHYDLHAETLPPIKKNPGKRARRAAAREEIEQAAEHFESFTGFRASKEIRFPVSRVRTGFALGKLVSVTYEQNRLGDGLSHYRHDFKKNSRPLLVSSLDGKQLVIVGGRFQVDKNTGINDT